MKKADTVDTIVLCVAILGIIFGIFWSMARVEAAEADMKIEETGGFYPHPAYGMPVKTIKGEYNSVLYKDRGHFILMYVKDGRSWGMVFWRIDHEDLKPGVKVQGYLSPELNRAHPEIQEAIKKTNKEA
jgi:hypothetical protein